MTGYVVGILAYLAIGLVYGVVIVMRTYTESKQVGTSRDTTLTIKFGEGLLIVTLLAFLWPIAAYIDIEAWAKR